MQFDLHPAVVLGRAGDRAFDMLREAAFIVSFTYAAMAAAITPSIYLVATREVTRRQVYYTAWRALPAFTLFATVFSLVIIEVLLAFARRQGLSDLALEIIVRVLPMELIPFLTALYIALRSGSAINTEIALMHIRGDIDAIEREGGDAMRDEFIPRIVACAFSVVALTAINAAAAFGLAYHALFGFTIEGISTFTSVIAHLFSLPILAGLLLKCALFGIAVAVIPIASGLSVPPEPRFAAVAVLRGMVRLFFTLALIETVALAAKYV